MASLGSSSTSKRGEFPKIKCKCGREAVVRTVKQGANVGMKFHGCPLWPDTHCDFFKWIPDNNVAIEDLRYQLLEKETIIGEIEIEMKFKDEKMQRLELKYDNVVEENVGMKMELSQMRIEMMNCSRNERNYLMALLVSWIFFAMALFYVKQFGCD